MKLYEIADSIVELQSIEVGDDESLAEAIQNSMEDVEMDLFDKLDNMVKMTLNNDAHLVGIEAEIKRLQARKKFFTNENASVKEYILFVLRKMKKKTLKTTLYTLTDMLGKMKVIIDDEDKIPNAYINIKMVETPDKRELLKALTALEEGEEIAGCHAEKSPNTLRIK